MTIRGTGWAPGLIFLAILAPGCGVEEAAPDESGYVALPPGKADNYLSSVMQEYDVTAEVSFALDAASPEDPLELARVEVARLKDAITRALESKLYALYPKDERHDDGAVIVMIRAASPASDEPQPDGGQGGFRFTYRAEVAGTLDLLPFADGSSVLRLELGGTVDPKVVELSFEPSARVKDSYPRYRDMFKDGLEIYIHYGGDYNEARWDLKKSRALFDKLVALGFSPPVKSFDELALDSGPFTRTLDVGGQSVNVRVVVVHPEMAADDELDRLVDAYKRGARSADVVIYSGHASEDTGYSGIVVHYNPRVALPAAKLKELELPDRYQLFVFSGCYTYTGYADQLLQNPHRTIANTDVITAVNSTPLSQDIVFALLTGLLEQRQATWFPNAWLALLTRVNDASESSWRGGFGVHGMQGNPTVSPLADLSSVGRSCTSSAECPGIDNLCVRPFISAKRVCGAACTDSAGCPSGSRCWWSFAPGDRPARQCVPVP